MLFKNIKYTAALLIMILITSVYFYAKNTDETTINQINNEDKNLQSNYDENNIKKLTRKIALSSRIYLENLALDELNDKIKLDMENKNIKAIVIDDIFLDKNILIAFKDEKGKILLFQTR
ncbi:MAG: hypothetical protein U9Q33_07750 [Campylobacterota bacterium]|nr:hypothetical protein [Campylobacterota bacterium]